MMYSKFPVFFVLLAALIASLAQAEDFDNDWKEDVNFECPKGLVLSHLYSVHDNLVQDRRWKFGCRAAPSGANPTKCSWSEGFANNYDSTLSYMCAPDYVLAGVQSTFSEELKDRRTRLKCCRDLDFKTYACNISPDKNVFGGALTYNVPEDTVLSGWVAIFDGHSHDRINSFITCDYNPKAN